MTYYHLNNKENLLDNCRDSSQILSALKIFLKNSLRKVDNLSILIGSGCSSGCTPLMGTTMQKMLQNPDIKQKVDEYFVAHPEEYPEGSSKRDDFKDIEGLLNWLQSGIQFSSGELNGELLGILEKIKSNFIFTIPSFDSPVYQTKKDCNKEDKNHTHSMDLYESFYHKLFSLRSYKDPKISIFTTNYDLYNEYALERNKIIYTTGMSTGINRFFEVNNFHYRLVDDTNRYKEIWQPTHKAANLYKIHGSINWRFDSKKNIVIENNHSPDSETTAIYPTAMKNRETAEHPYSELFREFSIQLRRPNSTLLVMGYGFPDQHINNIIAQNISNEDFNLIIFGNHSEEKCRDFFERYEGYPNVHLIGGSLPDRKSKLSYFDTIVEILPEIASPNTSDYNIEESDTDYSEDPQ